MCGRRWEGAVVSGERVWQVRGEVSSRVATAGNGFGGVRSLSSWRLAWSWGRQLRRAHCEQELSSLTQTR